MPPDLWWPGLTSKEGLHEHEGHDPVVVAKGPRLMRVKPPLAVVTPFGSKWLRSTWFLKNGSWLKAEDRVDPRLQCERIDGWVERAVWQFHPAPVAAPARERSPRPRPIHVGSGDVDMQSVLAAFVEELSDERVELKCINDLALDTLLRLKLLMRCLHTSHEQCVPGRCFVPYRIAVKHKPQLSPGIELALVAHDGSVLRAPLRVSLPGMRTRTIVTLYSVDLSRPIVLLACSEPRNWFTTLARHKGPQVVTVTLVDDLMSEYGGRIARHVLTKSSDLLFFAGPCTGGSSWARLNKTRGVDTAEKIEAKQKEFWMLFECFVEIKRHAVTKEVAITGRMGHEVVHDGASHEFDGCRYGLKQRYAKKPLPIKKPWRVVSWNFELGSSLSKKCNGNHEHGPCAGRETKEPQLYTSLIVSVILRRFLARAKCLQQARLKPALVCIVRGNPRRRQAAARGNHTTLTVPTRSRAGPGPQVAAVRNLNPFSGFTYCCLFRVFLVLENIIKMTANATVVNTSEFFCVPVGKSRQAAIFLTNLVKNAVEEGKRIPRRMETSSDLGTCIKWVEDIGVPVIYAYSAYYSAKCRGMMKGEGQSMRVALEFLSKIFGLLSADECVLGWREFSRGKKIVAALNQLCGEASLLAKNPELLSVTKYEGADMLSSIADIWDLASGVAEDNGEQSFTAAFHQDTQVGAVYKEFISDEPTRTSSSRRWRSSEEFLTTAELERADRRIAKFRDRNWGKVFTMSVIKPPKVDTYERSTKADYQRN